MPTNPKVGRAFAVKAQKKKAFVDFLFVSVVKIHDDFFYIFKAVECLMRVLFPLTGRQVKMAYVNSVAKPPRDVRRRQEKFGTTSGSTASSTAAAAPIK